MVIYNKKKIRSPLEEASIRARAAERKRLEDQRDKLKSGFLLEEDTKVKMKDLKLKIQSGWEKLK